MEKEYGLVYYDVPAKDIKTYFKMKRHIDRCCLAVNLSVYIFDWAFKRELEEKLKAINQKDGYPANVNFVKFDKMSNEELEGVATQQLENTFRKMEERIKKTLSELVDVDKKDKYLARTENKIKNYERLLTLYEFTKQLLPALNVLKKIIDEEFKMLKQ